MRRLLPVPAADVDLDEAYAVPADRVHVRANMVSSVDGAGQAYGFSEGLSGPGDKRVFFALRGLCDVILAGAGTVRTERYGPPRPSPERRKKRAAAGMSEVPAVAVVTRSLELDLGSRFFTAAEVRPIVLTCDAAPPLRREATAEVADVVVLPGASVDMARAVDALAERGLRRVLCEGGPKLLSALVHRRRLDELCLTVSPLLLSGSGIRILDGRPLDEPTRLTLRHLLEEDGFLFLRYDVDTGR